MDSRLTWALSDLFSYFLVFARLGGFMYFMPGISESYVTSRIRLLFALTLTVMITPIVSTHLTEMPSTSLQFSFLLFSEAVIGMIAGIIIKILLSTFELVGSLYGFQIGLSNAFTTSLATAQQTGLPSAFLGSIAMMLIFSLELDHRFLVAIVESYQTFPTSYTFSFSNLSGDFLQMCLKALEASFKLALQISAPIIIFGLIFMLAAGLLGRLVPQLQIFFVLQPFQLFTGFSLLIVTLALMMKQFFANFEQALLHLWGG